MKSATQDNRKESLDVGRDLMRKSAANTPLESSYIHSKTRGSTTGTVADGLVNVAAYTDGEDEETKQTYNNLLNR